MADRAKHSEEPTVVKGMVQKLDQTQHAHRNTPSPMLHPRSVGVPPRLSRPVDILMLQQTIGNRAVMRLLASQRSGAEKPTAGGFPLLQAERGDSPEEEAAPVQLRAEGQHKPSDAEIHSAAARGVSTLVTTLPFLDRIQASFGRHPISHIKAHVGTEAAQASRAMDALAFASGDHVVFGSTPDLRTAAHEAAHVVQQQAGVQLAGGIGREGDAYERHADAVAEAVVAGRSAEGLLEPLADTRAAGRPSTPTARLVTQRKSKGNGFHKAEIDDGQPTAQVTNAPAEVRSEPQSQLQAPAPSPSGLPMMRSNPVIQRKRKIGMFGLEAEVARSRLRIMPFLDQVQEDILRDDDINLEEYKLGTVDGKIDVTLDNEIKGSNALGPLRSYTVEFIQSPVDAIWEESEGTRAAWGHASEFWKSLCSQKGNLSEASNISLHATWQGQQFERYLGKNTKVVESDGNTANLLWKNFVTTIGGDADPDPDVVIQVTAGSTLISLDGVYKALEKILLGGANPGIGTLDSRDEESTEMNTALHETWAIIKLIKGYMVDPTTGAKPRYAKEYLSPMIRTSLDVVFASMSARAQKNFRKLVSAYLLAQDWQETYLGRIWKRGPSDAVFPDGATNEEEASRITVKDLSLSMIGKKSTAESLVDDPGAGDAFSKAKLTGISEINAANPKGVERFNLAEPNEMMHGETGLIFEVRKGKPFKLSEIPDIFTRLKDTLFLFDLLG